MTHMSRWQSAPYLEERDAVGGWAHLEPHACPGVSIRILLVMMTPAISLHNFLPRLPIHQTFNPQCAQTFYPRLPILQTFNPSKPMCSILQTKVAYFSNLQTSCAQTFEPRLPSLHTFKPLTSMCSLSSVRWFTSARWILSSVETHQLKQPLTNGHASAVNHRLAEGQIPRN